MLRAADMSNTIPGEKVVITSLSVSVLRCQSWEVFMLRAADMSNTIPDEKVVITSLSVCVEVSELGGIPVMLRAADMSHHP